MNIQQFAKTLGEKEDLSPLLEALRKLRTSSVEQIQNAQMVDWSPWPPHRDSADLHTKA